MWLVVVLRRMRVRRLWSGVREGVFRGWAVWNLVVGEYRAACSCLLQALDVVAAARGHSVSRTRRRRQERR